MCTYVSYCLEMDNEKGIIIQLLYEINAHDSETKPERFH